MSSSTTDQLDRMLHPDEARAIVVAHTIPLEPELVPLDQAGGRILIDDLIATESLPPFPAATMDGFAVIHDDPADVRSVVAAGMAGVAPDYELQVGQAARIMTGAPVPVGADAVIQIELTEPRDPDQVYFQAPRVSAGNNIRPIGTDMQVGDLLLKGGTRIGPAELGVLASVGVTSVRVGRAPRVAILSTGDELVGPGVTPGPGQIRDSNRFMLGLAAQQAGADVVINAHVRDDEAQLRSGLQEALAVADVVITSGGVSMGDLDLVKKLLGELSIVHFRRLFMKPGKPLNFATLGEKLVFGLPGNPVSAFVGFHMFVRPALLILQSAGDRQYPRVRVTLEHDVHASDRIEYQRVKLTRHDDGHISAHDTGFQISARLMSFIGANGLLIVDPGQSVYPAGSELDALVIDTLLPDEVVR